MEHLQEELDSLLSQLPNEQEVRDCLDSLVSVYPFNEYEYIIVHCACFGCPDSRWLS